MTYSSFIYIALATCRLEHTNSFPFPLYHSVNEHLWVIFKLGAYTFGQTYIDIYAESPPSFLSIRQCFFYVHHEQRGEEKEREGTGGLDYCRGRYVWKTRAPRESARNSAATGVWLQEIIRTWRETVVLRYRGLRPSYNRAIRFIVGWPPLASLL